MAMQNKTILGQMAETASLPFTFALYGDDGCSYAMRRAWGRITSGPQL